MVNNNIESIANLLSLEVGNEFFDKLTSHAQNYGVNPSEVFEAVDSIVQRHMIYPDGGVKNEMHGIKIKKSLTGAIKSVEESEKYTLSGLDFEFDRYFEGVGKGNENTMGGRSDPTARTNIGYHGEYAPF